jgi:hypothetical protein
MKSARASLQRTAQGDIDGVASVMLGNLIDVIIADPVGDVHSRVS